MMMRMMMRCLLMIPITAVVALVITASSLFCSSLTVTMMANSNILAATEAIQAAMEAIANYGPASPEAIVAWETVEEISAGNRYMTIHPTASFSRIMLKSSCSENFGSLLIQQ
jgi:CP12 domain